ncbi:MAG TPA: cell wall hydrolase [Sphingomonas sp.]|jgi:spore germination cell wall hydrolase CwlJ-like protein|uniref:cell wall hydrolase n=1 Tax=Sphingomonas sp. TaxID=28214 RepID=UPI002EDB4D26
MRSDRFPRRRRRWALPVSVGLIGASGFTWWAVSAHDAPANGSSLRAEVHAASAENVGLGEQAAPATGVTGTIALPALPSFAATAVPTSGATARPFSTRQASAVDRARALECLTTAIYYEAASEPDAGQRAVAQVVLNRVRHPAFPATICGVVYQGSERRGCQFSFACDGAMARAPGRAAWARAAGNAWAALAGDVYAPVGLATHYHTFAVRPVWNRGLVMTDVIGAHFFHRWKGWWGTGAAFRQAYRGGEPVPGPHGSPVATPAVLVAPAAPVSVPLPVDRSDVLPAVATSGAALMPMPSEDRLPPASEALDRWKDSGKPLK